LSNTGGGKVVLFMHRRNGFTLIELLVVIAIIAVLMSILMPGLNKAKIQARNVLCRSRLHQWGLIMKFYTDSNKGFFAKNHNHGDKAPLGGDHIKEYRKDDELLLCPRATKTFEQGARPPFVAWMGDPDYPLASYGVNTWIYSEVTASYQTDDRMWKTPNVRKAAKVPMVIDCAGYQNASPWEHDAPPEFDGQFIGGTSDNEMRYACLNRHTRATNMVFMDFSTQKVDLKRLWVLKWNRGYNVAGPWTIAGGVQPEDWPKWMRDMTDY
jgi:prepilin-type N-terminal cleavage/methylation domain-containing protein